MAGGREWKEKYLLNIYNILDSTYISSHLILIASYEVNNTLFIFQKRVLGCRFRFRNLCFSTTHFFFFCKSLKGEIALTNEQYSYLRNDKIEAQEIQMHLQNEIAISGHRQFILFAKQHTFLI